jgi:hypothetical protein
MISRNGPSGRRASISVHSPVKTRPLAARALGEGAHERAFPDAGLAGDKHSLPAAALGRDERLTQYGQLLVAPDERRTQETLASRPHDRRGYPLA